MISRSKQLFAEITTGGLACVNDMVSAKTPETHYLEFKGGKIQKDLKCLKEAWSEAISGFANTEGGVLIFGVRAAKVPHPENPSLMIDGANQLELVENPSGVRQWLRDRMIEATSPPLSGVEFLALDDPSAIGCGIVACYLPEGVDKPYRAELHPSKNYMQRVDDRFVVIQHSLLRTLFYPQLHPRLSVEIEPKVERSDEGGAVTFKGSIGNSGTATARELWIVVQSSIPLRHETMFRFTPRSDAVSDGVAWEAFQSVHPGATVPAFWYEQRMKREERFRPVVFSVSLFSQHQSAQHVTIEVSVDDIMNGQKVLKNAEFGGA